MIFKQWQQVLDGTKTQTRRPTKGADYTWTDVAASFAMGSPVIREVCGISDSGRHYLKWSIGKTYAVQPGRGKKSEGRVRIKTIRRERLGDISEADCLAEGLIPGGELEGVRAYRCPICGIGWFAPAFVVFSCLWQCCGGNWEQDQNNDVWVLEVVEGLEDR